ncbi:uncharacterized protein MELLADRAFT_79606 [Melampsora larici-populina 98AG31]|uniref:Dicer-like protein 1 n=1 Tax=Melampsora larici-populina (strain 98AG31 / pathotype 3-4-7) TaxID=747676 RepID=F4S979_MELLP|nr:uncharacterized protein MELLADRAFT_79606 [Melampsora larici-populina 98AG31]EGF98772.1 hypothetical protein MELLADRAFT_79606 [Melampsora larici-populina 98AG31]
MSTIDTDSKVTTPTTTQESEQGVLSGNKCPRLYQEELLEEAKRRNIIIRADTGTGKTLVAVLLMDWMAVQPKGDDQEHTIQAFLVPTRPLVQQQASAIRSGTTLRVREYTGDLQPELWNVEKWHSDLKQTDVIVCTAQIFYDILSKGFWTLENVSLLVFDEAHHCRKNHIYNQIMQVHYRRLDRDPDHRRVPKILGLTASPIWDCKSMVRAEKDIRHVSSNRLKVSYLKLITFWFRSLQSDLSAQLYEIKVRRHDVEKYANKPKEEVVYFTPADLVGDDCDEPYWKQIRPLVDSHADSKFFLSSKTIREQLGTYAHIMFLSDWLSDLLLMSKGQTTQAPRLLEPTYRLKINASIKSLNALLDSNDVPLSQSTPKFQALVKILSKYENMKAEDFHAIIFVERRTHAQLLNSLISRCAKLKGFIKPGALTGHGGTVASSGGNRGMDSKSQNQTVEKFRNREINLAIATNVAEEGLDFRACRLVIRFDDITTWKGEELRTQLYGRPEDEEISDAELESTPQLINSLGDGKDAILTHNASVSLLNEVCQLLPHDEYAEILKPKFEDIQRSGGFVCRVTLPPMAALSPSERVFESEPFTKKNKAKQSACFIACRALRSAGVLDEHFMPLRERHTRALTDADGRALLKLQIPDRVEVACPNPFGDALNSEVWLHKISFDLGESKPLSFGFLCGNQMLSHPSLVIYDHHQDGKALPIVIEDSMKMCWSGEERSSNLLKLDTFTRMGIQATLNRRAYDGQLLFFLAALEEDGMEIDWDLIEKPTVPIGSFEDLSKYQEVVVPLRCLHERIFTSHFACTGLTVESKPADVPSHPHLVRFIRNASKFKSLAHFFSVISSELRTELQSPLVYLESDFKSMDNLMKKLIPKASLPFRVLLPLSASQGSRLPSYFWKIFSFIPALTRRLHDASQVQALLKKIDVPHVSLDLATMALTQPGIDVPWDYQTLETVGDAFLKLATSVHVYLSHTKKGEGDMSALRSKSVDNEYLRSKSLQAGLGSYVLSSRYRTDTFRAAHLDDGPLLPTGEVQRKIPRRVLSDIVEALLGAGLLSGGIQTALKIGTELDLCFGGVTPWTERPCKALDEPYPDAASSQWTKSHTALQHKIGYEFKQPLLLMQALTHRSADSFLTNCYEREEWLGDAIVDLWITEHCYRRFSDSTAAQLTFTRASLVTNASLGYLSLKKLGLHKMIQHDSRHFEKACDDALRDIESFIEVGSFYDNLTNSFIVFDPPKILGDALEAIVGAIFIDCGLHLSVAYRSLDKIFEDVLPRLKQDEPRDPISLLLRTRDTYCCSELGRVTEHVVEKKETSGIRDNEDECESFRLCKVSLHGKVIATGRHRTSNTVAEQRASLNAYELLRARSDDMKDPDRPDPWLSCNCKQTTALALATANGNSNEDDLPASLTGKRCRKSRLRQNKKSRLQAKQQERNQNKNVNQLNQTFDIPPHLSESSTLVHIGGVKEEEESRADSICDSDYSDHMSDGGETKPVLPIDSTDADMTDYEVESKPNLSKKREADCFSETDNKRVKCKKEE